MITQRVAGQQVFKESAEEWGINHYHRGMYGGGAAIFDFNNDGFEDIYLTGGLFRDKLYKNNGNKTFTDVTLYSGFAETSRFNTMSVAAGDINNDGYKDLFVGTMRNQKNLLYLNNGDNTFSEISSAAGLERYEWAIGAAFGDFNLDGALDIYVINYVKKESLTYDDHGVVNGFDHDCFPNQLFINNDDLTFTEWASDGVKNAGCGLAVTATDINDDHAPDIYVANDFGTWITPNTCLQNNYPDSSFTDVSTESGLNAAIFGMGIAVGDCNRDGLLDYYVSNLGSNVLFQNDGGGHFTDIAAEAGVLNTHAGEKFATSWGTAFFDYDLDGFEDLFVSNGFVPAAGFISTSQEDPNQLYRNLGDGTFADIAPEEGIDDLRISRGMAIGDLDNDGDQDMIVTIVGESDDVGSVLVYENQTDSNNRWVKVSLIGTQSNHFGYGSKILAISDGIKWIHEVDGGSSHASHNSSIAHFGVGNVEVLDSLHVIWPGGYRQTFSDVRTNQMIVIEEDQDHYFIAGCTAQNFDNYDPSANYEYGCYKEITGCLDQLSSHFDINANVAAEDCDEPLSTNFADNNIVVSPNPALNTFTITLPDPGLTFYTLRLLDLSGTILMHYTISSATFAIERGSISSGIYLIQVIHDGELLATGKVILE